MISSSSPLGLALAVVLGAAFGWLLHRGRVASYDVIVNQLRLRDFTVLKVMGTAIVVGGLGVLLFVHLGLARWHVRDANLLATLAGGAIFGAGMALLGYCPGTAIAAMGAGSLHAVTGVAGMILGAILYAGSFDWLRGHVLPVWKLGKVTLADVTGIPAVVLYVALAALAVAVVYAHERRRAAA